MIRAFLRVFTRLGRILWRSGPIFLLALFVCTIILAAVPNLELIATKIIVDSVVNKSDYGQMPLVVGIFTLVGALLLGRLVSGLDTLLRGQLWERAAIAMHSSLMDALDRLPGFVLHEKTDYRDRIETVRDNLDWLPGRLVDYTSSAIGSGLMLFGMSLVLWSLSPWLVGALVIATVPYALSLNRFEEIEWGEEREQASLRRRLRYISDLSLGRQAAKEVRLFGTGPYLLDLYRQYSREMLNRLRVLQRRMTVSTGLTGTLAGLTAGGAYLWLVVRITGDSVAAGDIAVFLGAVLRISTILRDTASLAAMTVDTWRLAQDWLAILETAPDLTIPDKPGHVTAGEAGFEIEFRDVTFAYPSNPENKVLRGVSFKIAAGERVAIVGENGAGKSTIVKLLCRFYDPTAGMIFVNGRDIRELDPNSLRSQMSVVFQDFGRYGFTVLDNIAIGSYEYIMGKEEVQREAIERVARDAAFHSVVEELPDGYESMLGPEWGGVELSGGQWQRLALARALLRGRGLVILDEPTAALDVRAEYEFYRRFNELTQGRTAVIISHRFSTVRAADRILVLHDGRIVESGSHEELLRRNGIYADMYHKQAAAFVERGGVYDERKGSSG